MNNLIKGTLTLTSIEVAEMVGKDHSKLLRDIRTYIEYLGQNPKLDSDDFFIESSYKAGTGKEYKKYDCTKKGCEFIAHKLTGQKGALFTATYINRFHEMEEALAKENRVQAIKSDSMEVAKMLNQQVGLILGEVEEIQERVGTVEKKLDTLEISPSQRNYFKKLRNKKVLELLGGKKSKAYKDSSFRGKVYSDLTRQYNNYFDIPSYELTPKNRFEEGIKLVNAYNLTAELSMELDSIKRK